MKVDLGAGMSAQPGWLSVDVNPRAADVLANAAALPFRRASIEGIRAVDVLEHLSYRETDTVLAEWSRVVEPGGILFVQVPAADVIMRWFSYSPHRLLRGLPVELPQTALAGATWRLLGGHNDGVYADAETWLFNAHFAFFSDDSLREHLDLTGWEVTAMKTNPHPNLQCFATRR